MEVAPSGAKSRSLRHRHGSLKARRPPSPDSACEHDAEWVTGDMSEEVARKRLAETTVAKGPAGQDSDVDSGIVTCRKPGERIGSTSSADTDSSQESRRRIDYSPPIPKSELSKSRSYTGSLRVPRRSSCLVQSGGPVKGDHSALKECNRRPPTPLTVFPDSHHCVRFDEQLQLSEQNIRRSCRKLFATLYAQRFSYPSHQDGGFIHGRNYSGSTRSRSRTVPELELRRYSPLTPDGYSKHERTYKENVGPLESRRSGSLSSSNRSVQKSTSDVSITGKVTPSPHVQRYKHHIHHRFPMDPAEDTTSHTNSTDSGLGSLRSSTQCTCHDRQSPGSHSSSQSPSQSTCRCCSCTQQLSKSQESSPKLFKSSSCSTLPSVLSHQSRPQLTQFPPRTSLRKMVSNQTENRSKSIPLQKTSSCSSLLDRTSNSFQLANVPVYNDNMLQVYARIASVIPDDFKTATSSQGGRRAKTLGRLRYTTDNIHETLRQSNTESPRVLGRKASITVHESTPTTTAAESPVCLTTSFKPSTPVSSKSMDLVSEDSTSRPTSSVGIYSQIADSVVSETLERKSIRENRTNNSQRPKSMGMVVPNCGPNPVYLKSALKKPTQSAMVNVNDMANLESELVTKPSEVEYAVVDKSKKNRFASLPALNGSPSIPENEEKDPPVPPKKMLHKSDFSLYRSRSSSPKKGLLERMQALSRTARSALQKAFSTERIYRPEREERLEAAGQKGLQRSRSFIKGLTGSFRKKKRKSRPPMAEVVAQASSNPEWDEQPSGPNSPIHVRGQLLQLNLDGSQVVELTKPPSKPYGFFVARGRVRNSKGVFVSRMRDQETQKQLAGLLDIGDEILEIDGLNVKEADIMEVNSLMANKNTLLLTVLPYICRKDI
ncbi:PDZ domain-containing protein [Trichonephila clavata]|uniref:PDZ domain-containing protein n=2 Tax=Trichonephila clavata TaxID=2740835 RepID=A0A8X6FN57_TRICU|nr:PDZ domain-containing protein [Trichonephila clavata]